ncbi:hypothetical protein P280DRAFT_484386 [Massarina eburnea CBS 473.64]|uniref:Uncharacterized protein n=1 Tax=Massarina eburnea CBS 473.64 TaxID=1395130 RepID=A0A6A6RK37_9PLEO|nr:hypothetical protein P280DRAFT_484386 [Massarina eburnea CBS 473.64]
MSRYKSSPPLSGIGSTISDLIPLFHTMSISANSTVTLVSPGRIEVAPGVFISSTAPITFFTTDHPYTVSANVPLGSGFVKGWNKLPDELKLQILSSVVSFPTSPMNFKSVELTKLEPFIFMTPEIRALSTELFYGKTTILSTLGVRKLPPLFAQPYVRKLELTMCLCDLGLRNNNTAFAFLRRVSKGETNFQRLQHIRIIFSWAAWWEEDALFVWEVRFWDRLCRDVLQDINLPCSGIVDFRYHPQVLMGPGLIMKVGDKVKAKMEKIVRDRFHFNVQKD